MDAQAKRKALFRSKLRESSQNRDKRIDSPLVRYNEYDQPVCRVCNVILKSESLWPAHQASRKHHEAIESVKATAAGLTHANKTNNEQPAEFQRPRPTSSLPADFFDNPETKRNKAGHSLDVSESVKKSNRLDNDRVVEMKDKSENKPCNQLDPPLESMDYANAKKVKEALHEGFSDNKESAASQTLNKLNQAQKGIDKLEVKQVKGALPDGFFDNKESSDSVKYNQLTDSKKLDGLEPKQVKGALPEGFFDNKDADLRARGIEPVKIDINDAYKEFEKEIQDDLQGVDDRLGEEEIDAAEIREEFESLEQKAYREKVEMVKKQLMEVKAARIARGRKSPAFKGKESSDESSSDGDDDENFAVDWRAKHL